jgi:DNA repair protein RecO (recombination protein O)
MLHKTKGIVLRTTPYSDSSIIIKVYTEKFGMQSYIVHGARSTRSKGKSAIYRHGNLLDMVVYHKDSGDIFKISEAGLDYTYIAAPFEIVKSSLLLFSIELLTRSVREAESNADLFQYVWDAFIWLDKSEVALGHFHLCFSLGISQLLGFAPSIESGSYFDLQEGRFCQVLPAHGQYMDPTTAASMKQVIETSYTDCHTLHLTHLQRKQLLHFLLIYFRLHTVGFGQMHSPAILEEVLRD